MKRKLILATSYLIVVFFLVLCFSFYSLYRINKNGDHIYNNTHFLKNAIEYRSLPQSKPSITIHNAYQDVRVDILEEFFSSNGSPLTSYGQDLVKAADKNHLDYRLLPAIAMHESSLCKKIPKDSYNCFGFGIYGGKITRFANYQEAIEIVSRILAREYIQKGYTNPYEIMNKYTPSSDGSWAQGVSEVMNQLAINL